MKKDMDFNGDELTILYVLAHDHAADCREMLETGDLPPTFTRGDIQGRIELVESATGKLHSILSDLGIDADSFV